MANTALILALERSAAIHEAGHAVVACGLHLKIEHAQLLSEAEHPTLKGRVRTIEYDGWDTPSPWARIAYCVAGYAAEGVHDPDGAMHLRDRYDFEPDEPASDLRSAERAAVDAYASGGRAWRAIIQAWARVDAWLREPRHWACVEAIAGALLQQRMISGGDLYDVAERYGVELGDRRLLPKRRPFFVAEC